MNCQTNGRGKCAGASRTDEDGSMADTIKDKAQQAGHKVSEKATEVGHKVGEKMEEAKDWMKETAHKVGNRVEEAAQKVEHKAKEVFGEGTSTSSFVAAIREHMDVLGSCGNKLGRVDHVQGNTIKLTRNGSPDGLHHFIPTSWVSRVDDHVHLNKACIQAKEEWKSE
jgi:ElaB/YqjD/DUF883 family membrane-anchored ribosome-binding protein